MPVNPLAAAAVVALCFALPFGVAELFGSGPKPQPVAVSQPAVQQLDDVPEQVRIARLNRAPRLPRLREEPWEPAPAPAAPPAEPPGPAPAGGSGSSDSVDSTR